MPEWRELYAHWVTCKHFLALLEGRRILGLWGDATKEETRDRGLDGFVQRFGETSTFVRGTQGIQTHVVPVATLQGKCKHFEEAAKRKGKGKGKGKGMKAAPKQEKEPKEEKEEGKPKEEKQEDKPPPTIQDLNLVLQEVYRNGHAFSLILDIHISRFGRFWARSNGLNAFLVAFLMHTSIQCYKKDVWKNSIMAVSAVDRGFKVGLALEFDDFFLCFLMFDLVFQPEWLKVPDPSIVDPRARLDLGPDIIADYPGFLKGVADWVKERRNLTGRNAQQGLACDAVRHASLVWVGVGAYTVCEIFFIAELQDSVRHFGSLHMMHATFLRTTFSELLWKGSLRLARITAIATPNLLYVWAKSSTRVTPRHGCLIANLKNNMKNYRKKNLFWYRDVAELPDAFEPQYMIEALLQRTPNNGLLDRPKPISLGPLIFGKRIWKEALKKGGYAPMKIENDPLTSMFQEEGYLQKPCWLNTSLYTDLQDPSDVPNSQRPSPRIYLYAEEERNIWSVIPAFSEQCLALKNITKQGKRHIPVSEEKQYRKTFKYIVKHTKGVSIGPLEYCGHGFPILKDGHRLKKKYHVAAVRGDPALPDAYRKKALLLVVSKRGLCRRVLDSETQYEINRRIRHARATDRLHHLLSQDPPRRPPHCTKDDEDDNNEDDENKAEDNNDTSEDEGTNSDDENDNTSSKSFGSSRPTSPLHLYCLTPPPPSIPASSLPSMRSSSPAENDASATPPPVTRPRIVLSVSPFKTVFKVKKRKNVTNILPPAPDIVETAGAAPKEERRRGRDRCVGADGHMAFAGLHEMLAEDSSTGLGPISDAIFEVNFSSTKVATFKHSTVMPLKIPIIDRR
ncbi:hypothetical protein BKA70DRAFT_1241858 [Coprinopsis sp. MPI-PUGE-AT-0042]|nr:hypothetical protein BKA70DRAFT_1241858 [Coprinopsis sp. MPI-PUGE-AT-0042]